MRRVVVTGLGAVSPFGAGVKAYWAGIAAGLCAIRPLTLIDPEGFRCQVAAEVPEDGLTGSRVRQRRATGRRSLPGGHHPVEERSPLEGLSGARDDVTEGLTVPLAPEHLLSPR